MWLSAYFLLIIYSFFLINLIYSNLNPSERLQMVDFLVFN
jgi:hypothetical protein